MPVAISIEKLKPGFQLFYLRDARMPFIENVLV
jgi:hypothetical protein